MNTEEFPKGGELDSLHLSLIEKKYEYDDFRPEQVETNNPPISDSPLTSNQESVNFIDRDQIVEQKDVAVTELSSDGDFSLFPINLDSGTENLTDMNPNFPSFPNDLAKDSDQQSHADVVEDTSNPAKENRRSSIELRLQNIIQSNRSSTKPPPSSIKTKPALPSVEIPSPLASVYDIDLKSKSDHRDLFPLLPLETNLIYGPSQDASMILNDIKTGETKAVDSATFSDALSKDSGGTPASATSWLSKTSSSHDGTKYQLTFPNGDSPAELANAKRNAEFRELFPSLDPQDRLIDDFTCAWLTDMLMHGRMYVTQNNVCFYAKVIWTYQCVIPIPNILSIEKKVVGRLFDNALEICIKDKSYYFTSFLYRNQAYDLIIKVINGYPNSSVELKPQIVIEPEKRMPSKISAINSDNSRRSRSMGSMEDSSKAVNQLSYSRSGVELDIERKPVVGLAEIVSPSTSDGSPTEANSNFRAEDNMEIRSTTSPEKASSVSAPSSSKKFIVHQKHKVTTPTTKELANTSTKIAPHTSAVIESTSRKNSQATIPFECLCIKAVHSKQSKCLDIIVSLSVMESWQYLYSFESLHMAFCQKLWITLGFTDIKGSDWLSPDANLSNDDVIYNVSLVPNPLNFSNLKVGFKRKIEYTRSIANPVGPKSSKVFIEEKIISISSNHVCIDSVSSTPSAPSGDCFRVRNRFCILSHSSESTTRLVTSCNIEYIKSTWMKVVLDSAVPAGVKDYQAALAKELDLFIKSGGIPKREVKIGDILSPIKSPAEKEIDDVAARHSSTVRGIISFWNIYTNRFFLGFFIFIQFAVNVGTIYFIYKLNTKVEKLQSSSGISHSESGEL